MKTEQRTRVWLVEFCPANKPATRRIWCPVVWGCWRTRQVAKQRADAWGRLDAKNLYRAAQYKPAR